MFLVWEETNRKKNSATGEQPHHIIHLESYVVVGGQLDICVVALLRSWLCQFSHSGILPLQTECNLCLIFPSASSYNFRLQFKSHSTNRSTRLCTSTFACKQVWCVFQIKCRGKRESSLWKDNYLQHLKWGNVDIDGPTADFSLSVFVSECQERRKKGSLSLLDSSNFQCNPNEFRFASVSIVSEERVRGLYYRQRKRRKLPAKNCWWVLNMNYLL